jgi:hypothetical protein
MRIGGKRVDPAAYLIVIPDKPTAQETFAAAELADHLEKITGNRLAVIAESALSGRKAIIVGRCDAAIRKLGMNVDFEALGLEGVAIETRGSALVLAGNKRGVLYAVYTFLEDYCGCRWFTPDCTVIPRGRKLDIGKISVRYVPPLELRSTDYPCSRDADWAVRNKINGTQTGIDDKRGGKISYSHFVHTFNDILNPAEHFAAHPEYFSEVGGKRVSGNTQLCMTNPDVLEIAKKTVRRWIKESPEATIFSVSQNDWKNYCTCAKCKALADQEDSQAGPLIAFVNAIGDDIAKDYPDKIIDTLAYQWGRKPPKTIRPSPNVCVRLCSIECCFAHSLAECDKNRSFVEDIRGWHRLCNRLYIWDYVINYAHSIMPFPNMNVLRPNIRFFVDNGVKGMYEEACYFTKGSELAELRTWVIAKTLWDPDYDTGRAVDEFLNAYYGPAANSIRQYLYLVHRQVAEHKDWHVMIYSPPTVPNLGPEVIAEAVRCFDEAEKQAGGDPVLLHRVQVARLPVMYCQIAAAKADNPDAAKLVRAFESVAKEAGITCIREGGKLDEWFRNQRARLKIEPAEPR